MRGRPFVVAWHARDSKEALRKTSLAERGGALRSRLHALWLLRSGKGVGAAIKPIRSCCPTGESAKVEGFPGGD